MVENRTRPESFGVVSPKWPEERAWQHWRGQMFNQIWTSGPFQNSTFRCLNSHAWCEDVWKGVYLETDLWKCEHKYVYLNIYQYLSKIKCSVGTQHVTNMTVEFSGLRDYATFQSSRTDCPKSQLALLTLLLLLLLLPRLLLLLLLLLPALLQHAKYRDISYIRIHTSEYVCAGVCQSAYRHNEPIPTNIELTLSRCIHAIFPAKKNSNTIYIILPKFNAAATGTKNCISFQHLTCPFFFASLFTPWHLKVPMLPGSLIFTWPTWRALWKPESDNQWRFATWIFTPFCNKGDLYLVVEPTHLENMRKSNWIISLNKDEHKHINTRYLIYLKPPARYDHLHYPKLTAKALQYWKWMVGREMILSFWGF